MLQICGGLAFFPLAEQDTGTDEGEGRGGGFEVTLRLEGHVGGCPSLKGSDLGDMQEEKSSRAQDGERERPLSLKRTTCLRFVRVSGSEITLQPRRLLPNRSFSPTGVLVRPQKENKFNVCLHSHGCRRRIFFMKQKQTKRTQRSWRQIRIK